MAIVLLSTCSGSVQAADYFPLKKKLEIVNSKSRTIHFYAITFLVKTEIGDTLYSIEREQVHDKHLNGEYVRWQKIKLQNSLVLPPSLQPNELLDPNQFLLIFGFSKPFYEKKSQ